MTPVRKAKITTSAIVSNRALPVKLVVRARSLVSQENSTGEKHKRLAMFYV